MWAWKKTDVDNIEAAIRAALIDWSGTYGTLTIDKVIPQTGSDVYDHDIKAYGFRRDYRIMFREPI